MDFALTICERKWNAEVYNELLQRFEAIEKRKSSENIYEYVASVAYLLELFFELADNIALIRFFKETTFVTNVAAQTKWRMELIESYHQSIHTFIKYIEVWDFQNARLAIKDVILWVSY